MAVKYKVTFNFECVNCPESKAAAPRKMGFCTVHQKKVSKTYSCNQNPNLSSAFLLFAGGGA